MSPVSFTFVLPTLNAAGPLFVRALGSIRAQSYPPDSVEIVVADGGSTDDTRAIAERFDARTIENPNVLAEWGVKEGFVVATGEVVVVFAADNELVDDHWLERVGRLFQHEPDLSATFGRLVSGANDPALNKYMELIQSEPLNWFLNRNLDWYLERHPVEADGFARFDVDPARPLIWGANGLAVRREHALAAWKADGYVADVDAFHAMVRAGHSRVAYSPKAYCFHHQVRTLRDLRRKWLRNASSHLVEQARNRDLEWVLTPGFRSRAVLWVGYSLLPLISTGDAVLRARRDRSLYWLYHPVASLLQTITYAQALVSSKAGREVVKRALGPRRG